MKLKTIVIILFGLALLSCGRSKESDFYILNPLPPQQQKAANYAIQIGLDEINLPHYTEKPQLMIHYSPYQVQLEEYHRWAESLDKNIGRVIEANLSTLLPGAVIESYPWNVKLKPNYHLQIDIFQFEIDYKGDSVLRAEYVIYHHDQLIKKYTVYYHLKLKDSPITINALVKSMNTNLNHLTLDIASSFKKIIN